MEDAIIRWIEYWVGRPLCALLTLHRRLRDWLAPDAVSSEPPRRVVFIKLIEQGSTVLAGAALQRAIDLVGRPNVYFCVFEENRGIVDLLGLVPKENVISLRADRLHLFALDALGALLKMRRLGIDATIDLEGFARASAILAYLSGAKRRVGLHRFTIEAQYRGDLMTHRVAYNPYLHTSRAFSLLVEALTLDPREVPLAKVERGEPELPPRRQSTDEERRRAEQVRTEVAGGHVGGPVVLLNPNAHDRLPLRKWPTERFVELGQRLLAKHESLTLAVTGAPSERAAAERVCEAIGSERVTCVAGRTTLGELLSLYDGADVLVTNDSGPAHFASMTNIDIVALFGPETPHLYGPLGPRGHFLWAGLACSPCVNVFNSRLSPCTDNRCMQAITVEQVCDTVELCLAERRGGQESGRVSGAP